MLALITKIRGMFFSTNGRKKKIKVSIQPFVPKASTPFQWSRMNDEQTLKYKVSVVSRNLRREPGVEFSSCSPRTSILQGVFSMGDRKVCELLCMKALEGLPWKSAWKRLRKSPDFYVHREKDLEEVLPWDMIDTGLAKKMLWDEYQKARM